MLRLHAFEFWGTYLFGGACFWMSGYWYARDMPRTLKPKTTAQQNLSTQHAIQYPAVHKEPSALQESQQAIRLTDLAYKASQQNLAHAYMKVGSRKQELDQERKTLTEMDQELRRRYWKWDMAGGPEYWRFSPEYAAAETKNILADCLKVQKRQQEIAEEKKALEVAEKELRRRVWLWGGQ